MPGSLQFEIPVQGSLGIRTRSDPEGTMLICSSPKPKPTPKTLNRDLQIKPFQGCGGNSTGGCTSCCEGGEGSILRTAVRGSEAEEGSSLYSVSL